MRLFCSGWRASVLATACTLVWSPAAQAELWGYVDATGTAHFAAQKQDERYVLFSRDGASFDTAGAQPSAALGSRATAQGVTTAGAGSGLASNALTPAAGAGPGTAAAAQQPRLLALIEVSPSYRQVKQHLREASSRHNIDYELLKALIATESGFDARAVSPKGAVGLMQIMPATAERYGVVGDHQSPVEQKLVDPKTNIRTGARYLSYLLNLFPGKLELALAAYNAGEGAVQRAGNRIPNFRETQNYVRTVMQLYLILKPAATGVVRGLAKDSGGMPNRVRMELSGASASMMEGSGSSTMGASASGQPQRVPHGGAFGRGNLPAPGRLESGLSDLVATDPATGRDQSTRDH